MTADTSCNWSAAVIGNPNWVNLTTSSGTGSGQISFSLGLHIGPARQATIFLVEKPAASCTITQTTLLTEDRMASALTFTSELDVEGGRGQVVVDGSTVTFVSRGSQQGAIDATPGAHRVEATVVGAAGRPGTWRFRLVGPVAPGSVRVIAGAAVATGGEELVFRVSGKVGERILFVFRAR